MSEDNKNPNEIPVPKSESTPYASPLSDLKSKGDPAFIPVQIPMDYATREELTENTITFNRLVKQHVPSEKQAAVRAYQRYSVDSTYQGHWIDGGIYGDIFKNPEADFKQVVNGPKGPIRQRILDVTDNGGLSGKKAVLAIRSVMGQGKPGLIQLWRTGLSLTVGNFKESELLELEMSLSGTRVEMAYEYSDIHFNTTDAKALVDVTNFVLDHVTHCNLEGWQPGDITAIKRVLRISDIIVMLAGALASIYPTGYPVSLHCKNSGLPSCSQKPTSIVKLDNYEYSLDSLMDFKKTALVDTNRLTQAAIAQMSRRDVDLTPAQLTSYFNDLDSKSKHKTALLIQGNGSIEVEFEEPTFFDYERITNNWIGDVRNMVERALTRLSDEDPESIKNYRSNYIIRSQKALRMQRAAPWVKSITLSGAEDDMDAKPVVIDDLETINETLDVLGDNNDIESQFIDSLNAYKSEVQISYTGISSFECPSCKTHQSLDANKQPTLIPMNMVDYFFTIMVLRWERAGIISIERPTRVNVALPTEKTNSE